jgi:gamma-tubulin complex component 2
MDDQELIPRLRSLKRYFFLSQSAFLTHFLDLAGPELRKPAKGVSTVKLQSLLDLALNSGESFKYKEDVKVVMATSGLYEWLLKVVSVSGAIGGEGDEFGAGVGSASVGATSAVDAGGDETNAKDKDKDKKQLQGKFFAIIHASKLINNFEKAWTL